MKIHIVSDLHLEFSDWDVVNKHQADVLVLAGDIMVSHYLHLHPLDKPMPPQGYRGEHAQRFRSFLKKCSERYEHVIYVPGNHEFYQGKWKQAIETLRQECATYPNINFLEMDSITIDDVVFVGGALWTDMNNSDPLTCYHVANGMNDYKMIVNEERNYSKLRPVDTIHIHKETLKYIKQTVSQDNFKYAVITHHSPSHQSIAPQYLNDQLMNGAFHNNLDEYILDNPSIKLWVHGHTHSACDYLIGDTRVVCNPRGYHTSYQNEATGWDPDKVVEL